MTYKVFCADCKQSYEQGAGRGEQKNKKPVICGACGSDFIAVKEVKIAYTVADVHGESLNDACERLNN